MTMARPKTEIARRVATSFKRLYLLREGTTFGQIEVYAGMIDHPVFMRQLTRLVESGHVAHNGRGRDQSLLERVRDRLIDR